jgi:hypothetical protein
VVDPNEVFASNPMTDYLRSQPDYPRALNLTQPKDDQLPYQHIDVMVGYHGNQLRWFDDLIGSVNLKNFRNPRLINLLGVKYLIDTTGSDLQPNAFGEKPLSVGYTLGRMKLIRNENAFPRVYLAGKYQVVPDRQSIYPLVLNGAEDLRSLIYLEEEPGLPMAGAGASGDTAWISSREADAVTVNVRTGSNTLLVMTDTWFDAWKVTVDGQPARLLRAYGALRAVPIPAGAKEVRFEFHSDRYTTARMTTGLTSVFLLCIFAWYLVDYIRKRKRQTETPA